MTEKCVVVIGYGALGKILVQGIQEKLKGLYRLAGVWEQQPEAAEAARKTGIKVYASFEELVEERPDYVVEIASKEAVETCGERILANGMDLVVTSVGALADSGLYDRLRLAAEAGGQKVYVTSGAVGGFDVLQTIEAMGGARGRIENFKAPDSLNGAPYLEGRSLSEEVPERVFTGTAREAIKGFPKNVNVAVASAIASVGVDQMEVIIESRPGLADNIHKITVENDSVRAVVEISSKPDESNPKSSVMTAWSVVALLRNLAGAVQLF